MNCWAADLSANFAEENDGVFVVVYMCACDGIGRHARFRFSCRNACGFESLQAHQVALTKEMQAKIPHFGAGFLRLKQEKRIKSQQ